MIDFANDPCPVPCPTCSEPVGKCCRTAALGVGTPPHPARLQAWIEQLMVLNAELQHTNEREARRMVKMTKAIEYVLDNVRTHAAVLEHLRNALSYDGSSEES